MRRVTQAWWGLLFSLLLCLPAQARSHHAHAIVATSAIAISELPPEARATFQLIKQGGPFPYARDGVTFGNYEHALPPQSRDCTSDTLLTKSAACGRRCEAGAPAPKGSAPPCRTRYHEYTVHTPGVRGRGPRRIVCGTVAECYYSDDHYRTFRRIKEARE